MYFSVDNKNRVHVASAGFCLVKFFDEIISYPLIYLSNPTKSEGVSDRVAYNSLLNAGCLMQLYTAIGH